jgi:hypothetical protein
MADYNTDDIVSYLNGRMNAPDAAAFEKALPEDPTLAEELEAQRKLSRLVQIAALKNRLNDIREEFEAGPGSKSAAPVKKIWGWIALAAVIAGIGLFLFLFRSSPADKIFKEYFSDDSGTPSLMGDNKATPFDQAMVYYKSGNYEAAEAGFSGILNSAHGNDSVRFYEALSLVRLKKEGQALTFLQPISGSGEGELSIKAKWYLALVLIHQNKPGEAAGLLKNLANSDYADKANAVLAKLKSEKLIN